MQSALSVDLRERVIAAIEAGTSRRRAAKRFGIGPSSAIRWHERFQEEGAIAPRPPWVNDPCPPSRRMPIGSFRPTRLLPAYKEHPQAFLREVRDTLAEQGVWTSVSGLWRFFSRHAITRKKGLSTQLSRNGRT